MTDIDLAVLKPLSSTQQFFKVYRELSVPKSSTLFNLIGDVGSIATAV